MSRMETGSGPSFFSLSLCLLALLGAGLPACQVTHKGGSPVGPGLGGGDRPGDQIEEIPGYIARPTRIEITPSAQAVQVRADAGTFAAGTGSPDSLVVRAFRVSASELTPLVDASADYPVVNEPLLGKFRPAADGSAEATIPASLASSDIILFSILSEAEDARESASAVKLTDVVLQLPTAAYRMVGLADESFEGIYRNPFRARQWKPSSPIPASADGNRIAVAIDGQGNAFLAYVARENLWDGLYVSRRPVNGDWEEPLLVGRPNLFRRPRLVASPDGMAVVAWDQFGTGVVASVYQPGQGWSQAHQFGEDQAWGEIHAAAADGKLALGFVIGDPVSADGEARVYRFEGGQWRPAEILLSGLGPNAEGDVRPHFTPDGMLAFIWAEQTLKVVRKTGTGWAPAVQLDSNLDPMPNFVSDVDANGRGVVVWIAPSFDLRAREVTDSVISPVDGLLILGAPNSRVLSLDLVPSGQAGLLLYYEGDSIQSLAYRDFDWHPEGEFVALLDVESLAPLDTFGTSFDRARGNSVFLHTVDGALFSRRYVMGLGWGSSESLPETASFPSAAFGPEGDVLAAFGGSQLLAKELR